MILSNKIAYFASPLDNCGTSYRVNSSSKLVPIKLEFNFTLQLQKIADESSLLKIRKLKISNTNNLDITVDKVDIFNSNYWIYC